MNLLAYDIAEQQPVSIKIGLIWLDWKTEDKLNERPEHFKLVE